MPQRYMLVVGTFLLSVLLYVDRTCIATAKEGMVSDLGLSDKQWAWVLASFSLGYALLQAPSGALADRLGPRRMLTAIVALWSLFTGLTAAVGQFTTLLGVRFLFGAGEAGAFPGMARAAYSWIPLRERGLVQGINFSGSRLGAAFAMPGVAYLIEQFGWRSSFVVLMLVGLVWSVLWWLWFRDDPTQQRRISAAELEYIGQNRQQSGAAGAPAETPLTWRQLLHSHRMWLLCFQYFASNFTFFFCLTHWFPHLKSTFALQNVQAGWYAALPLLAGAGGNWFSGWLVDFLYRRGRWSLSRRLPGAVGFALATIGTLMSLQQITVGPAVGWFALAIFGADMTLAPSWSFCLDIGRKQAGLVSGTMNMAGNLGAFITSLAYEYLKGWSQTQSTFFWVAASLNLLAIGCWLVLDPQRPLVAEAKVSGEQK